MVSNWTKIITLLGLIAVVTSLESAKVDTKKCRKRNGLFYKHGSLCRSYYRCTNWIPTEETCPEKEHFNAIKGWCDWKELYPCLEKPKHKECIKENGRFLKPGTNCKIYYDCCNGEVTEKKCPEDQLFDPSDEKCEWSELYTCVESLSTVEASTKIRSTTFRIFPSSTTNRLRTVTPVKVLKSTSADTFSTGSSFISLSTSIKFTLTNQHGSSSKTTSEYSSSSIPSSTQVVTLSVTPEEIVGSTYNKISNVPDVSTIKVRSSESFTSPIVTNKPSSPGSSIIPTGTDYFTSTPIREVTSPETLNILCPERNGYFPHPTDKHKFVGCVDNLPYVFTCPDDLVYRHELRRCEYL